MKLLITNIGILAGIGNEDKRCLRGAEMSQLYTLENAYLYVENGRVAAYGRSEALPKVEEDVLVVDAQGGAVLPSFCDSHTHIVYAGSREGEFVDKIRGLSYAEIAKRGGGILNSADRLHELSEDELYAQAMKRVDEVIRKGTGAIEIKSGYGLNLEDELKMLRVIRRIKETTPLKVVSNFLGAHAVGRAYAGRQSEYVDHIINDMLPAIAKENLADFIDVFCDEGFFTADETRRLLQAGAKYGLRGKIHGEELAVSGGVEVAVECNALSVDHLEAMDDHDIDLLKHSDTMPTALPGTSFFLNMPFAPGRKMIDAGLAMAIASDYNPGSTPSGDMKFAVSLACIKMRLMPAEAINAATINSACAMGLSEDYGSLAVGKVANFYITDPIPSIDFIPYAYTTPIIRRVFLRGEEYVGE
ncbi:imidazolonepropionase [Prevotella bivia DNF00188]|jgi:imidazolonepropionase|uniref:imidazolonepropionase n=1 Tax=Prevotella bivia TaxID=28125 RepID=UPI000510062F|nr:imidazolonepropionase [Prevotella bivia]KGF23267.1 imidazolonepropionase [Prevotella bivia DNF00188]KGF37485.1 imidazolonepropionase [Prevotella bivia DNF00650]MDU3908661.1 imidazolonepropionase [Prevotella bivia]